MTELAFLIMGSHPGGIELQIPLLVGRLKDLDPVVYLVHGQRTKQFCIFKNTGITPIRGARQLPASAVKLYVFAKHNRDRIFHAFNIGPLFLLILRLAGVNKIIYSIRGTIYWKKKWQKHLNKLLWKLTLGDKVRIISNSGHSGAIFRQQICSQANIIRIYNPIDTDRFYMKRNEYPKLPRSIIYAGRLAPGKNLHLWIDAAQLIAENHPHTEFHIYGDGALRRELEIYAEKKGLSGSITFHGFMKDIEQAYKQADLMIFLSDHESFGNVVVEAILAGVPVICSDIPSLQEIFHDHPEFIVELNPDTPKAILHKISEYPLLSITTMKAQDEFKALYNVDNHINQLRKVYCEQ